MATSGLAHGGTTHPGSPRSPLDKASFDGLFLEQVVEEYLIADQSVRPSEAKVRMLSADDTVIDPYDKPFSGAHRVFLICIANTHAGIEIFYRSNQHFETSLRGVTTADIARRECSARL